MAATRAANIPGFTPFTDKGIVTGITEKAAEPTAARTTAIPPPIMPNYLVRYDKTMVFKAKPLTTLWAMDGMNPVDYSGYETDTN
jgi:hypothetical protein